MPVMNMIQAINDAHKVMMRRDPDIVVYGEDVGFFGGVFRATEGLQKEFGKQRCFDAPISEGGIVGTAVGMAAKGLLIAAIEDPDPVNFFEPKRIYNGPFDGHHDRPVTPWARHKASEVPEGHYTVPLGKAEIVREGEGVTILAYGTMVHVALAAV